MLLADRHWPVGRYQFACYRLALNVKAKKPLPRSKEMAAHAAVVVKGKHESYPLRHPAKKLTEEFLEVMPPI